MVNPVVLFFIFLGVLLMLTKPATALARKTVATRQAAVELASRKYGIPATRIYAMIDVESANNERATGSAGERGLLQMKPGALSDVNRRFNLGYTFDDLYVPEKAIDAGAGYLRILREYFAGDLDKATQAYNRGIGTVAKDSSAGLDYLERVRIAELMFETL